MLINKAGWNRASSAIFFRMLGTYFWIQLSNRKKNSSRNVCTLSQEFLQYSHALKRWRISILRNQVSKWVSLSGTSFVLFPRFRIPPPFPFISMSILFSRVLRFFVPSARPSVRPFSICHTLLFFVFAVFGLTAPAQIIKWPQIWPLPTRTRLG